MDFVIIFALGYCFRDFTSYLKSFAENTKINKEFKSMFDSDNAIIELDEWSSDDLP
tara:strand:+ start:186 stop:353 length:168 start_codon:yes stop_codon:yes gene_type:complete